LVDLREVLKGFREFIEFPIPRAKTSPSTEHRMAPRVLRERILSLRAAKLTLREIAREVGLHFTRVHQIIKELEKGGE